MMKKISTFLLLLLISKLSLAQSTAEIKLRLEKLNSVGAVLYIAAHPDDENTRLLAYLANELKVRTAYLSLTRGDGGQNLIGTEQSEKLGMIRTQELLAARSIDGAEQYFTRAFDFGFSKNPEETLTIWQKDSIVADMVWVIRNFRPDVIITRFPTDGSGGHGHHTASAMLAEIAMDAAADPNQFKEQLKFVSIWKVKRLVWNGFNFTGRPQSDGKDFAKLDIGLYNSLLGKSYGEIASTSRSQHKSQGFGVPMQRGSIVETFKYVKGDTIKTSIFDGVDFTWNRIAGSKKIQSLIDKLNKSFDVASPEKSINDLILLDSELDKLSDSYWKNQKKKEVKELIVACAGIFVDVNSADYFTTPGSSLKINIQAINRASVNVLFKRLTILNLYDTSINMNLEKNKIYSQSTSIQIPKNQAYSNPYWLVQSPSRGIFHVSNQMNIGKSFNDATFPSTFYFSINGKEYSVTKDIKYKWTDPVKGELYRALEVIPKAQFSFNQKNLLFTNTDVQKKVQLNVIVNKPNVKSVIRLKVPSGWDYSPKEISYDNSVQGNSFTAEFDIISTSNAKSGKVIPMITIDGEEFSETVERIQYDHIPTQTQVKSAAIHIEKVDVLVKGKRAGYIQGAGDEIPEALKNLGYEVVMLTDEYLSTQNLSDLDVIIAGIRLYNTNEKMQMHYDKLMKYVENGGNYVVQYNTSNFISSVSSKIGPYTFKIGRERVTDEFAPMNFINSNDPILNYPNKISEKDLENWVQERGLYFLNSIDEHYSKTFLSNDPGEKPNDGILISCKYGKGVFTYTGISFFRQLPAGVPGAYRLFANIISQTK